MRLKFHTLDVFTEKQFSGNPLAVVLGADGLDAARMQKIAREFNLSETVFVMKSENPAHNAKIRIFTPGSELPFAGHPTVGTAVLLAELRASEIESGGNALVMLEENVGVVRVGVRHASGAASDGGAERISFAEFDVPKLPQELGPVPSLDDIAAIVGLVPSEIGFANHKPRRMTAGAGFLFVPVISVEAIGNATPNLARWNSVFGSSGSDVGTFLYTGETEKTSADYHARMFAPHLGVMEDPATGGAAAAFGGIVQLFDALPDGTHRRQIEQGVEMGRPSLISVSLDVKDGKLSNVRIGGCAVRVSEGEITI